MTQQNVIKLDLQLTGREKLAEKVVLTYFDVVQGIIIISISFLPFLLTTCVLLCYHALGLGVRGEGGLLVTTRSRESDEHG